MPATDESPVHRSASRARGDSLARLASTLFLLSGAFALLAGVELLFGSRMSGDTGGPLHTFFPVVFYAAWVCGVLGGVATIVTLFVQGFRARWFWRMLLFAAVLWMTLPPLGTALGIFSIVLLVATRREFPLDARDAAAP
jgi:hypothetical protein